MRSMVEGLRRTSRKASTACGGPPPRFAGRMGGESDATAPLKPPRRRRIIGPNAPSERDGRRA
jgi:hypothetical protein